MDKETRAVIRTLKDQGAEIRYGKTHIKIYNRDGKMVAVLSGSLGDKRRGWLIKRAELRRLGFKL